MNTTDVIHEYDTLKTLIDNSNNIRKFLYERITDVEYDLEKTGFESDQIDWCLTVLYESLLKIDFYN